MTPDELRNRREQMAYIKDVKEMILGDARALFSTRGYTSHKATFDVITSTYAGAYQATLVIYPDLTNNAHWDPLYDGLRCKDMPSAFRMLWDGLQTSLGDMKAMHHVALMYASPTATASPATTTGEMRAASPETPTRAMPSEVQVSLVESPNTEIEIA